jgi:hypothetical protein
MTQDLKSKQARLTGSWIVAGREGVGEVLVVLG